MAKYYYNGVLLPEIPEDESARLPYCWIGLNEDGTTYDLVLSAENWYWTGTQLRQPNAELSWYTATRESSSWTLKLNSPSSGGYFGLGGGLVWANHDIRNGYANATDIYFYGSEPVPEIIVISKYLIRSGSTIYTVTDGALTALPETNLNANLFLNSGFDSIPDSSLLVTLADPEVFYWHDSQDDLPVLTANVTGTPFPQTVITNDVDMSDPTVLGIESVEISASDDVLFAMSFDGGTTWKGYINQWVTLEAENSGMTAAQFRNIPIEAWAQQATTGHYMVRFILSDADSYVERITIHYIN